MNDKYTMFKNFMCNELDISKEDIRNWVGEAVKNEVEKLVKNAYNNFNVVNVVKDVMFKDEFFSGKHLNEQIKKEVVKQLLEKFDIDIKKNYGTN